MGFKETVQRVLHLNRISKVEKEFTPPLQDILYFDFEKASSIWSQLQWGQPEQYSISTEVSSTKGINAELGAATIGKGALNFSSGEKRTVLETRILHHDLLNRIQVTLIARNLLIDINASLDADTASSDDIWNTIGETPYVIAHGWSVIEDYQRILSIGEHFPELAAFISKSAIESVKKSPAYVELQNLIQNQMHELRQIRDPNKKTLQKTQLDRLEAQLNELVESAGVTAPDKWVLDGINSWITTFMPTRINFRVYPFPKAPSFQILCNLKRDSFVDQDLEHLLYGLGTNPNIPLGIIGLITSKPNPEGPVFDPLAEFDSDNALSKEMEMERAFRNMFQAMDGLEAFVRYSRYPNITVHPIAVFRPLPIPNTTSQET